MRCFICSQIVLAAAGLFVRLGMAVRKNARAWLPAWRASFFARFHSLGHFTPLGREFRDVLLFTQPSITFRFRDDDVPKAWKASYLAALD